MTERRFSALHNLEWKQAGDDNKREQHVIATTKIMLRENEAKD